MKKIVKSKILGGWGKSEVRVSKSLEVFNLFDKVTDDPGAGIKDDIDY